MNFKANCLLYYLFVKPKLYIWKFLYLVIYHIEPEIKDTTYTARSASYHDIYLDIDSECRFRRQFYNKRDCFNFPIVKKICSNIPASVFVSRTRAFWWCQSQILLCSNQLSKNKICPSLKQACIRFSYFFKLFKKNKAILIFNSMFRYIDDIRSLNNSKFGDYVDWLDLSHWAWCWLSVEKQSPTKHNTYGVNQELEHFDDVSLRYSFVRINYLKIRFVPP
jgi:hypothetical protein